MKRIFCDRCGKDFTDEFINVEYYKREIRTIEDKCTQDLGMPKSYTTKQYDICKKCHKEFVDFMNRKE